MSKNGAKRDYEIDLFKPGDAPGIVRLFREVYGEEYPIKIVYDPERLVTAFERGEYIHIVARTAAGRIVGYTSLYRSAPHTGLYEVGLSLVLPDYRNTPVAGLMFRHCNRVAPTISGLDALFCETVCNHTLTQRAGTIFKFIETAMEIDLMPAEAYEKEQTARGRVSTLDIFKTSVPKPHVVYIPEFYADYSRYVYDGFDDGRTVLVSAEGLSPLRSTALATQEFDFAQLARVCISEAGADFERVFDAEEKRLEDKHRAVIQVWLQLSWPEIGAVVDLLRARGYFLGGILPRWFGDDGFLMQKVIARPNWEGITLYTDRAAQILRFIRDDWEKTQGASYPRF